MTSIERYQRLPSEDQMQEAIEEAVRLKGGRVWHLRDARTSPELADLPDLIIVVDEFVALLEIKSQTRRLTPGQQEVAGMLRCATRTVAGVVRPDPYPGEWSYQYIVDWLASI